LWGNFHSGGESDAAPIPESFGQKKQKGGDKNQSEYRDWILDHIQSSRFQLPASGLKKLKYVPG